MFSNSHFQFQTQVKRAADGAGREVVLANPGLVEARWQDTHTHHYADDADYADDDVESTLLTMMLMMLMMMMV